MSTGSVFERRRVQVLDCPIDALGWADLLARIDDWVVRRESRYICFCNVHSVVTARRCREFRRAIEEADTAAADGWPIAWRLRRCGHPQQERINGPDLMWRYLERAAGNGTPVYFYGASDATLARLIARVRAAIPALEIAGATAPPFRALSAREERQAVTRITASGAQVVFVGLGCPKQELWMARQRGALPAVMLGVGAAFDYHAGTIERAPHWMQLNGLEWLYRLWREPRRLWRRYLVSNARYLWYLAGRG